MIKKFNSIVNSIKIYADRNRIAATNLLKVIQDNYTSCNSVYKGFFGEPTSDNDLFTSYKMISFNDVTKRKIHDCTKILNLFGWQLVTSTTNDDTYVKIIMIPNQQIQNYMNDRTLGKEYPHKFELYAKYSSTFEIK